MPKLPVRCAVTCYSSHRTHRGTTTLSPAPSSPPSLSERSPLCKRSSQVRRAGHSTCRLALSESHCESLSHSWCKPTCPPRSQAGRLPTVPSWAFSQSFRLRVPWASWTLQHLAQPSWPLIQETWAATCSADGHRTVPGHHGWDAQYWEDLEAPGFVT